MTTARAAGSCARAGGYALHGLLAWAFALLWAFVALGAGLAGGLPTSIGVGAMAAGMAWQGTRILAKARAAVRG